MVRTGIIGSFAALAVMAAVVIWTSNQLPSGVDIPIHWNAEGVADGFAPKAQAVRILWSIPAVSAFCALLLAILPRLDPLKANLYKSAKAYVAIWLGVMALMALVTIGVCLSFLKGANSGSDYNATEMVRWIMGGTAILIIILGNYLPKTRRNWFLGIRTPWTLSSDITWEKTHRLGGRLFMVAGIISLMGVFVLDILWITMLLTLIVCAVGITSIVYSYFVWQNAPDR